MAKPFDRSKVIHDNPKVYEDTSFVTGESPADLTVNADLGRNGREGYIINDGDGNFTVSFSGDGSVFGDAATMKKNEKVSFTDKSIHTLRITWVADSAYRVSII